ncbi:MAG: hypothetical protein A3C84_05220 [Candidatus Ryanbacteria bacterium RIFCSPHIGHO2_02_FULL_48_12]|uniref:GMP synthase n=1 Tax=Candidatus Ryanbacteria bacterium RIFCSPHIGHO2_01_FULL_48_27 TaxID=1802115 RepID=A0A1G2G810_9BACT|nr:MAG: hypothetical protein A2756_05905 [Candidatus Ryanbacteria bacterium RIFCSPHIGHO2_01_FULL_48_27]OGZ49560.1 MAG: hypothetical protein A3C84_05220 [Candidatus Ryanbacteria bacterium RIFCSPHIGHO2_02_FULL_48_12]
MYRKDTMAIPDHRKGGQYLKDVVYGANDGIITTFAVVAGVAGADLSSYIVFLLGLANLFADGFSMAASNYLGTKSEQDFYIHERSTEEREWQEVPEEELAEMRGILLKRGYSKDDVDQMLPLLFKNKNFWLDLMLKEELALCMPEHFSSKNALKSAVVTFIAFVGAGLIPLAPYFIALPVFSSIFYAAIACTAIALFIVGSLRAIFTRRNIAVSGLEMLFVGGVAASIAYGVGYVMSQLFGV